MMNDVIGKQFVMAGIPVTVTAAIIDDNGQIHCQLSYVSGQGVLETHLVGLDYVKNAVGIKDAVKKPKAKKATKTAKPAKPDKVKKPAKAKKAASKK